MWKNSEIILILKLKYVETSFDIIDSLGTKLFYEIYSELLKIYNYFII